jgi:hypothetical protein
MALNAPEILNAGILIFDDQAANVSLLEQLLGSQEVCALHQKPLRPDPAGPADAPHGWLPGDGGPQSQRHRHVPAGDRAHGPARAQAACAAGRRQGLHQQAF